MNVKGILLDLAVCVPVCATVCCFLDRTYYGLFHVALVSGVILLGVCIYSIISMRRNR